MDLKKIESLSQKRAEKKEVKTKLEEFSQKKEELMKEIFLLENKYHITELSQKSRTYRDEIEKLETSIFDDFTYEVLDLLAEAKRLGLKEEIAEVEDILRNSPIGIKVISDPATSLEFHYDWEFWAENISFDNYTPVITFNLFEDLDTDLLTDILNKAHKILDEKIEKLKDDPDYLLYLSLKERFG